MPSVSQDQRRLFFWQRAHPTQAPRGAKHPIAAKVVKEFTDSDPGGKLPERVHEGKPVRGGERKARRFGALG
jgi:hypothetical protein